MKNAVGVDPEILDEALNFSLELNQRYRQGTVGKILGYTIEGGEKMDPSIMLERTLGSPASRGAISRAKYDQLAKAADGSPEFKAAAEDYIRNITQICPGQLYSFKRVRKRHLIELIS